MLHSTTGLEGKALLTRRMHILNLSVWRGCFFKHCQSIYPTGLAGMSMLAHRTHILKSVALARLCFLNEHCEITHPTGFAGMLILTHRTHMLKAIALGRLHSWRQRSGSTPITGLAGNRSWYMKHTYQTISRIGERSSFYFGKNWESILCISTGFA